MSAEAQRREVWQIRHAMEAPSTSRNRPLTIAMSLAIAVIGAIAIFSLYAHWMVATGPKPYSWDAFRVGDSWRPGTGADAAPSPSLGVMGDVIGTLLIGLGVITAARIFARERSSVYPTVITLAIFVLTSIFIAIKRTQAAISSFNSPDASNGFLPNPDTAHFAAGVWIFCAALVLGLVVALVLLVEQLRQSESPTLPGPTTIS
jgi:hypothetical protein